MVSCRGNRRDVDFTLQAQDKPPIKIAIVNDQGGVYIER